MPKPSPHYSSCSTVELKNIGPSSATVVCGATSVVGGSMSVNRNPVFADALWRHRRGISCCSWWVDEIYVRALHSGSRPIVLPVPGD